MARSRPRTAQCKTAELQGKESSPECARQLSPARATGSHQPWSPVAPQLPASSSGNRGSRAPGRTPTLLQRSSDEPTLDLPPKTFYFNGITRQRVPPLLAGWANHSRVLDGVTIPGPPAGIPAQAAWAPSLTWDPTRSRLGFASGEPDSRVAQTAPSGTSGTGPGTRPWLQTTTLHRAHRGLRAWEELWDHNSQKASRPRRQTTASENYAS